MRLSEDVRVEASHLFQDIRKGQEPSRIGYLVQGLFAHTLLRMKRVLVRNEPTGHPDIVSRSAHTESRFEVSLISVPYRVDPDDLAAIAPTGPDIDGFLAVLDHNFPMRWLLLPHDQALRVGARSVYSFELEIRSCAALSSEVTAVFAELIRDNKNRLRNLDFGLLRKWAEEGLII